MRIRFKMTRRLLSEINQDLARPHQFAAERVGFIACKVGSLGATGLIVLGHSYNPVNDEDYLDYPGAGATINSAAIRKALEFAYKNDTAMFHVHAHEHAGTPHFSRIDEDESARFVPDFWNVRPDLPHGVIILSYDSAIGKCWYPGIRKSYPITEVTFIGSYMRHIWRA